MSVEIRINYDDEAMEVIDKVNRVLAAIGYEFQLDGKEHDGYEVCVLIKSTITQGSIKWDPSWRRKATHKCESCTRWICFGKVPPRDTYCPNCMKVTKSIPLTEDQKSKE